MRTIVLFIVIVTSVFCSSEAFCQIIPEECLFSLFQPDDKYIEQGKTFYTYQFSDKGELVRKFSHYSEWDSLGRVVYIYAPDSRIREKMFYYSKGGDTITSLSCWSDLWDYQMQLLKTGRNSYEIKKSDDLGCVKEIIKLNKNGIPRSIKKYNCLSGKLTQKWLIRENKITNVYGKDMSLRKVYNIENNLNKSIEYFEDNIFSELTEFEYDDIARVSGVRYYSISNKREKVLKWEISYEYQLQKAIKRITFNDGVVKYEEVFFDDNGEILFERKLD
jgi:hypothetical protein